MRIICGQIKNKSHILMKQLACTVSTMQVIYMESRLGDEDLGNDRVAYN